jgi:hypothetical protein
LFENIILQTTIPLNVGERASHSPKKPNILVVHTILPRFGVNKEPSDMSSDDVSNTLDATFAESKRVGHCHCPSHRCSWYEDSKSVLHSRWSWRLLPYDGPSRTALPIDPSRLVGSWHRGMRSRNVPFCCCPSQQTANRKRAKMKRKRIRPIEKGQTGHRLVTDWLQIGHRLVTDWLQTGHTWSQTGHRLVTDWSQTGHSR